MNDILRFNTGRQYSPEGQKIEAQVIERGRDYWGPFMRVRLADTTRRIWGIATIHGGTLNQEDIMQAYDNGRYEDTSPFFFD